MQNTFDLFRTTPLCIVTYRAELNPLRYVQSGDYEVWLKFLSGNICFFILQSSRGLDVFIRRSTRANRKATWEREGDVKFFESYILRCQGNVE